jgi:hypothetical protein
MKYFFRVIVYTGSILFLISCAPSATPAATQIVTAWATPAAEPWLNELFTCANDLSFVLNVNVEDPEISLRIGEPEMLAQPAYQIDEEEILVVTHRESPIQDLSLEGAQTLFAGQGDPSAQVWVYAPATDVQLAFERLVMDGQTVTSFGRLATSPQHMSDTLNAEPTAVGVLPRHWKMGNSREVFSAGTVPVLALTREDASAVAMQLVACLQAN